MKKAFKIGLIGILFVVFTVLTQIGGIIYLLTIWLAPKIKWKSKLKQSTVFLTLYLCFTFLIVPFIAPLFGREKITNSDFVQPTNYMTVLLNRNYVRPELNALLQNTANGLNGTGITIHYLDANFPFINKFPLLPHLSHNDGEKIDLSFVYQNKEGKLSSKQKSVSGYGVFTQPIPQEHNQINFCKDKGYWQYDYPKYLTFGSINSDLSFSLKGTTLLINELLRQPKLGKIFIEPHLKTRMGLTDSRIRYHGCGAVRHDDHIHIQLK